MGFWFKGNKIKQLPIVVETKPKITSIVLNGETYLNYSDVIQFLMDNNTEPELRWALDRATYFTHELTKEK